MDIIFRYIRSGQRIDSSYNLYDPNLQPRRSYTGTAGPFLPPAATLDRYHVGDKVMVTFPVDAQINKAVQSAFGSYTGDDKRPTCWEINKKEGLWWAPIHCRVVDRDHTINFKKREHYPCMDQGSTTIILECISAEWEDLLLWLMFGDKHVPNWVDLDEGDDDVGPEDDVQPGTEGPAGAAPGPANPEAEA